MIQDRRRQSWWLAQAQKQGKLQRIQLHQFDLINQFVLFTNPKMRKFPAQNQSHALYLMRWLNFCVQFINLWKAMATLSREQRFLETIEEIPTNLLLQTFNSLVATPYPPQIIYRYSKNHVVQEQTNLTAYSAKSNFLRSPLNPSNIKLKPLKDSRSKYVLMRSTMCVDLINRNQFLKYSKPLLKLLVEISRKNYGLPPIMQMSPEQAEIWSGLKIQYPKNVLRYDELCYQSTESVVYIVTEDFTEYRPLAHYIDRARLAKSKARKGSQLGQQVHQQDYNNFDFLNDTQILIIIGKILRALMEILELERRINEEKLYELGFFGQIDYQQQERYMFLLKYLNPEQDILVHPQTLDVKIYNFGFRQDLDICTYEYKKSGDLADSNFIYRHPRNTYFSKELPTGKDQKYIQKYISEGLREEDIVWGVGMLIYRLCTGEFPVTDQNNNPISKLCRNDFQVIAKQLASINYEGIYLSSYSIGRVECLNLANEMLMTKESMYQQQLADLRKWSKLVHFMPQKVLFLSKLQMLSLTLTQQQKSVEVSNHHKLTPSEMEFKHFVNQINKSIKSLKKRVKFFIEPLYEVHENLSLTFQMASISQSIHFENELFIRSKLVAFKLIAEVRRRCELTIMDKQSGSHCVESTLLHLNERLNRQMTERHRKLLFKLRSKVGAYQSYIFKIVKLCNQYILTYCVFLKELEKQTQGEKVGLLFNVWMMVQYFMDCLYWTKRTINVNHRKSMIEDRVYESRKQEVQKIIEEEMRNCSREVVGIGKSIDQYVSKWHNPINERVKNRWLERNTQLAKVYQGLIFDKFLNQFKPGFIHNCWQQLENMKSLCESENAVSSYKIMKRIWKIGDAKNRKHLQNETLKQAEDCKEDWENLTLPNSIWSWQQIQQDQYHKLI